MQYMIQDNGGRYLRRDNSGAFTLTNKREYGAIWDSKLKAANVLKSSINKNLRSKYHIVEICDDPELERVMKLQPWRETSKSVASQTDVNKSSQDVPSVEKEQNDSFDNKSSQSDSDLCTAFNYFAEFLHSIESRRTELSNKLSEVDREVNDVCHYIELGKFNAYQGYMAFSMLRERLKKRRVIKNELLAISKIEDSKINSDSLSGVKDYIFALDQRHYNPRALDELFEPTY